jgi:hypothetical protein
MNNFTQCEEIHKISKFIMDENTLLTSFCSRVALAALAAELAELAELGHNQIYDNKVIMFLTSGIFAGVTKESFVAPQRLNVKGLS